MFIVPWLQHVNAEQCPICRQAIGLVEAIERKVYLKHTDQDRRRIVTTANRGEDWVALSMYSIECAVQNSIPVGQIRR